MTFWYYSQGGQQHGPVAQDELVRLAQSGSIKPADMLWTNGMPSWAQAASVPGLFPPPPLNKPPQPEQRLTHSERPIASQQASAPAAAPRYETTNPVEQNRGFFTFQGRTPRLRYFGQILLCGIPYGIGNAIINSQAQSYSPDRGLILFGLLGFVISIVLYLFPIVRRGHDLDYSTGLSILIGMIPLVSLILLFSKGTEGPNKYGPDPLQAR